MVLTRSVVAADLHVEQRVSFRRESEEKSITLTALAVLTLGNEVNTDQFTEV